MPEQLVLDPAGEVVRRMRERGPLSAAQVLGATRGDRRLQLAAALLDLVERRRFHRAGFRSVGSIRRSA